MNEITVSGEAVKPDTSNIVVRSNSMPSEHEMMVYHTMAEQAVTSKDRKSVV